MRSSLLMSVVANPSDTLAGADPGAVADSSVVAGDGYVEVAVTEAARHVVEGEERDDPTFVIAAGPPALPMMTGGERFATTPSSMDPADAGIDALPASAGVLIPAGVVPHAAAVAKFSVILNDGVIDHASLAQADELFGQIAAMDAGTISRGTQTVPHEFVKPKRNGTGATVLGATEVTFGHGIDRRQSGKARGISLSVLSGGGKKQAVQGASLFTLVHERVHAGDWQDLPQDYRSHSIPPVPTNPDTPLMEIYQAVLANLYADEALAFGSELRLADDFLRATGRSLYEFGEHARFKSHHDKLREKYAAGGFAALQEDIAAKESYLPYKLAAFYVALLVKSGQTDFPDVETILITLGFEKAGDGFKLDKRRMKKVYQDFIKPQLQKMSGRTLLRLGGITQDQLQMYGRLGAYFMGFMPPEEAVKFLREDLDAAVKLAGIIGFGDAAVVAASPTPTAVDFPRDLPARPLPLRISGRHQESDEALADRAALAAEYGGVLRYWATLPTEKLRSHQHHILRFAEAAHPEDAAVAYSLVMRAYPLDDEMRRKTSGRSSPAQAKHKEEMRNDIEGMMFLGISLFRSGYSEKGREYVEAAVAADTHCHWVYQRPLCLQESVIKKLRDAGLSDIIRQIFEEKITQVHSILPRYESGATTQDSIRGLIENCNISELLNAQHVLSEGREASVLDPGILVKLADICQRIARIVAARMASKWRERVLNARNQQESSGPLPASPSELNPDITQVDSVDEYDVQVGFNRSAQSFITNDFTYAYYFLERVCLNPHLVHAGLEILPLFPSSHAKLKTYGRMARKAEKLGLSGEVAAKLAAAYEEDLRHMKKAYELWGGHEFKTSSVLGIDKYQKPLKPTRGESMLPFDQSHFYITHTAGIARLRLLSGDASELERVRHELEALSQSPVTGFNPHEEEGHRQQDESDEPYSGDWVARTVPGLERIRVILSQLHIWPECEQKRLLAEMFSFMQKVSGRAIKPDTVMRLILRLATAAAHLGDTMLLGRIHETCVAGNLAAMAKTGRARPGDDDEEDAALKHRVLITQLRFLMSASSGIAGLTRFTREVKQDIAGKRQAYEASALAEGLQFIRNNPGNFTGTGYDEAVSDYALACADEMILQSGSRFLRVHWVSLMRQIEKMPLTESARDALLVQIIDKAFPEDGVQVEKARDLHTLVEAWHAVDFVLGNTDLPRAEARLLHHMQKGLGKIHPESTDPLEHGKIRALAAAYKRIADDAILSDGAQQRLAGLLASRPEVDVANLRPFTGAGTATPPAVADSAPLLARYRRAVQVGNLEALRLLAPELATRIENNLSQQRHASSADSQYRALRSDELFYLLWNEWESSLKSSNMPQARLILEILTQGAREATAMLRLPFYRDVLGMSADIEQQRMVFAQMAEFGLVPKIVAREWQRCRDSTDEAAEARLYAASALRDLYIRYGSYIHTNIHIIFDPSWVHDAVMAAISEYKRAPLKFKIRPDHPEELDALLAHKESQMYGQVLRALICLRDGVTVEKSKNGHLSRALSEKMKTELPRLFPEYTLSHDEDDWGYAQWDEIYALMRRFEPAPTPDQCEDLLQHVATRWQQYERFVDEERVAQFELPEFFHGRDPLTQFLLTQFYFTLEVGEQQHLLQALKAAENPAAALRIFLADTGLEKVAQFLSTWPEVPVDMQQELSALQDDVTASTLDEVRDFLRQAWKHLPSGDVDAILDTLEPRALGSGSIGEVWAARLPDGREIVIKLITPSKERKIRGMLKRLRNVRYQLALRSADGSLPHAAQAVRLLDLYTEMVQRELDLNLERENAEAMRSHLPEGLRIPEIHATWSSARVMVMQRVSATCLRHVSSDAALPVLTRLMQALPQWVALGVYHSDLMPGNILVDDDGTGWILDWGQVGRLTPPQADRVQSGIGHLMRGEYAELARVLVLMSEKEDDDFDPDELVRSLMALGSEADFGISRKAARALAMAQDHGIPIALCYWQLIKAYASFEGSLSNATVPT